jgi:hypothetical protein
VVDPSQIRVTAIEGTEQPGMMAASGLNAETPIEVTFAVRGKKPTDDARVLLKQYHTKLRAGTLFRHGLPGAKAMPEYKPAMELWQVYLCFGFIIGTPLLVCLCQVLQGVAAVKHAWDTRLRFAALPEGDEGDVEATEAEGEEDAMEAEMRSKSPLWQLQLAVEESSSEEEGEDATAVAMGLEELQVDLRPRHHLAFRRWKLAVMQRRAQAAAAVLREREQEHEAVKKSVDEMETRMR